MATLNTNSISGITTTSFDSTDIVNKDYVDNYVAVPSQTGNEGKFLTTTDGTSTSWEYVSNFQEFTTPGISTFNVPSYSNLLFIEAVGAGGGGNAGTTGSISGAGGASGSYTSWYIPKSIVTSNITVNPGVGGAGATTDAATGSAGAETTVSWTGPGGTYTLTASGGSGAAVGVAQTVVTSYFYTTEGLVGASGTVSIGLTATTQTNQFQPTGGGSGAGSTSSAGGSGGEINVYGISTSASGGTSSGTNGSAGIAYTGLPYGSGGGGGGASVFIAATGGNGARGGGGGGGASIGSTFGAGGNGGDGYVKITWW